MLKLKSLLALGLAAALALPMTSAFAGSKGRMNTAAILSGAALYSWVNYGHRHNAGRRNTALLTTAGAAYAWSRYSQARKKEHRQQVARAYYSGRSSAMASRARYGGSSLRSRSSRSRSARSRHYRTTGRRTYRTH